MRSGVTRRALPAEHSSLDGRRSGAGHCVPPARVRASGVDPRRAGTRGHRGVQNSGDPMSKWAMAHPARKVTAVGAKQALAVALVVAAVAMLGLALAEAFDVKVLIDPVDTIAANGLAAW